MLRQPCCAYCVMFIHDGDLWEKLRCSWSSVSASANFGMDAEIDATEPRMATLHRLRTIEIKIFRVPRTS